MKPGPKPPVQGANLGGPAPQPKKWFGLVPRDRATSPHDRPPAGPIQLAKKALPKNDALTECLIPVKSLTVKLKGYPFNNADFRELLECVEALQKGGDQAAVRDARNELLFALNYSLSVAANFRGNGMDLKTLASVFETVSGLAADSGQEDLACVKNLQAIMNDRARQIDQSPGGRFSLEAETYLRQFADRQLKLGTPAPFTPADSEHIVALAASLRLTADIDPAKESVKTLKGHLMKHLDAHLDPKIFGPGNGLSAIQLQELLRAVNFIYRPAGFKWALQISQLRDDVRGLEAIQEAEIAGEEFIANVDAFVAGHSGPEATLTPADVAKLDEIRRQFNLAERLEKPEVAPAADALKRCLVPLIKPDLNLGVESISQLMYLRLPLLEEASRGILFDSWTNLKFPARPPGAASQGEAVQTRPDDSLIPPPPPEDPVP